MIVAVDELEPKENLIKTALKGMNEKKRRKTPHINYQTFLIHNFIHFIKF